jgi:molybdopterin converting factor small subunit
MGRVTVRFLGLLGNRDAEFLEELELPPGTTVRGVVEAFARRHLPRAMETAAGLPLWESHVVMVNGRSLEREKQLTALVAEGDNVTIFFPVSGG